jgi:GT2 family glycosyltransferase
MGLNIYVVIVTYNPKKWIDFCFNSLRNSTISIKTIVIDNASTDGSSEIIKESFPEIDFIQSDENLGFGKANNIGIKKAYDNNADYVFLLNQDAWINNNSIEELVKIAESSQTYGILSPIHLNGTGNALDYNFSKYIIPPKCMNIYSDIYLNKTEKTIYDVNFINAAAWLISRKCIETVGGFSPSFFHYGEDDNYCERVLFHNLKIGVYPNSEIYHDREQRVNNNYFSDEKIFYKRNIVFKLSNPFSKRTKFSFYKSEFKSIYITLACMDFKDFRKKMDCISVLNTIDFSTINKNKEISKKAGKSFL